MYPIYMISIYILYYLHVCRWWLGECGDNNQFLPKFWANVSPVIVKIGSYLTESVIYERSLITIFCKPTFS